MLFVTRTTALLAIAGGLSSTMALAEIAEKEPLEAVIITATRMASPLTVETDPRKPRQPIPAHDGADYLKTVPGFSVIRKGGTDGDPVFRGMAGSRINMLLDGEQILGGCGSRMDPPTAYVFPEAYDRIVIIKGPQTVLRGPGNSAATVLFERNQQRFTEPGIRGNGGALLGSANRSDLAADATFGAPLGYVRLTGTRAESDDYEDGEGTQVHANYMRWSGNGTLGWTPDDNTRLELTAAQSDGEAAYADRSMDGAKFARDNVGIHFQRDNLTGLLTGMDVQLYYNYIDHVMDNFSLRSFVPSMMMPNRTVSNPDRRTTGGRIAVDVGDSKALHATVGVDAQQNRHRDRSSMNESMLSYVAKGRVEDARFSNVGAFGEMTWPLATTQRVIAGARVDRWQAQDKRATVSLMMGSMTMANPTANAKRSDTLTSGFARYEHDLSKATVYAGLGHVERFPDYWELISASKESAASLSAFNTAPEKTTQLDIGVIYKGKALAVSTSVFYSDIRDFILIESGYAKGMRTATITRNVDARTVGAEVDASLQVTQGLQLTGTLAYTYADNRSDAKPLAQIAPLEARLGVEYSQDAWSVGTLWRGVAAQHRYAINQGNIVGQDLGETAGFGVFSINTGWRASKTLRLSAGIDNFFDKTYAEHLSRSGSMVSGYTQTTRVNEPGRTAWVKLNVSFQ